MEKLLYNESVISVRPGGRKKETAPCRHPGNAPPEELHKTYIANTEAFYKVAGRGLAQELMSLWCPARSVSGRAAPGSASSMWTR